jgi:hypothetical protein
MTANGPTEKPTRSLAHAPRGQTSTWSRSPGRICRCTGAGCAQYPRAQGGGFFGVGLRVRTLAGGQRLFKPHHLSYYSVRRMSLSPKGRLGRVPVQAMSDIKQGRKLLFLWAVRMHYRWCVAHCLESQASLGLLDELDLAQLGVP